MEDAQTTGPTINDLIAQLQTELPWRKRRQIVLSLAKRAEVSRIHHRTQRKKKRRKNTKQS